MGLAALGVFLGGASTCFGPPVVERLRLELLPGGKASIGARVELAAGRADNPRVAARLAAWREEIATGHDPWSRRFAELEPAEERLTWERRDGELVAAERTALLADLDALERLFADSPVAVRFTREPGIGELVFTAGGGSRAGRAERREVERGIESWAEAVTDYLRGIEALQAVAGGDRSRERLLFGLFFDEVDEERAAELTDREREVLAQLDAATETIAASLSVAAREADTLEERVRLVYDPFPAPLEVTVRGRLLEVEGFERREDGTLAVPDLSLWGALGRLAGVWPALVPFVDAARDEGHGEESEIDLSAFLAAVTAGAPAPDAAELRAALDRQLESAPVYRVRWAFAP